MQIRGAHGEHTETNDHVYDISNKRRLGLGEVSLVQDMYNGVKAMIEKEKELMKEKGHVVEEHPHEEAKEHKKEEHPVAAVEAKVHVDATHHEEAKEHKKEEHPVVVEAKVHTDAPVHHEEAKEHKKEEHHEEVKETA